MRRAVALAAVAAALGLGACGSEDENQAPSPAQAPARESEADLRCGQEPRGVAADGVRDDQGGSVPGTDPCGGPGT